MAAATTNGLEVLKRQTRVPAVASPDPSIGTDQDAERRQQWDQAIFARRDHQGRRCLTIQREFCL